VLGDGTSGACPCGPGLPEHGCPNSTNLAGAVLSSFGQVSISNDTFTLYGTGMPQSSTCLYFPGTSSSLSAFGDGLRCIAGTVIASARKTNVGGVCSTRSATGADAAVSVRGLIPADGGARFYQLGIRTPRTSARARRST
jgi:hypothetical protein